MGSEHGEGEQEIVERDCSRCHKPIDPERLAFQPSTRLCMECKKLGIKEQMMVSSPCVTNKAGSIKKNEGGVNVEFLDLPILTIEQEEERKREKEEDAKFAPKKKSKTKKR